MLEEGKMRNYQKELEKAESSREIFALKKENANCRNEVYWLIEHILLFLTLILLLFKIFFGVLVAPNDFMKPRIIGGDLLLYYRLDKDLINGDVIIYNKEGHDYVGRVIATNNETIEITKQAQILVNGAQILERDEFYRTDMYGNKIKYPVELKDDEVFALADYRTAGKDSRYFGPINNKEIKGKLITVVRRKNF